MKERYTIGIDLGGTNSVIGIVDAEGKVVEQTAIKTQDYATAEEYVAAAVKAVRSIADKVGGMEQIGSMGIGAPNGNILTGCIETAPNIAWAHEGKVPLVRMFGEELGIPVTMTNDANAAAIGEMKFGVAKDMKDFIVITLGTGVGSGIVCNGKLVYGADGNAGELGHLTIRRGGRLCGCGRRGCLEAYCSATGIVRTAKEWLKETNEPSALRNMREEEITSYAIAKAAEDGDEMARRIYDYTGTLLGEACADMMTFSSPEAFIFFGGMAKAGELLFEPMRKAFDDNVMPIFRNKAKFLMSGLKDADAAIIGAASL
ncbi:MAG: ROK family protein [Prevotella sp.]|nr:ROK family protein [Prevotella sp.]